MAHERTIRRPKRPLAYALLAAAAALILSGSVAVLWRLSHATSEAPMQLGER